MLEQSCKLLKGYCSTHLSYFILLQNLFYFINQSIFIYIRQPEPIVAKPIHIKRKKRKAHTTQYKYYHTDKRDIGTRHLLPKITPIFFNDLLQVWFYLQ